VAAVSDHRALHLSRDQADAIELGARYCRTLAALEHAHILGDEDAVINILAGVDPIEVKLTANALQALAMIWNAMPDQVRSRSTAVVQVASGPLPPDGSAAHDGEQPSAPIPLHRYSTKVPGCS
jgi:hypothetical protein